MGILGKLGRFSEPTKIIDPQNTTSNLVVPKNETNLNFTKEEFEFLFQLIKNSTVKGTDLQLIFGIISKLQTKYLEKTHASDSNK